MDISNTSFGSQNFELMEKQFPNLTVANFHSVDAKILKAVNVAMEKNFVSMYCKHLARRIRRLRIGPHPSCYEAFTNEQ